MRGLDPPAEIRRQTQEQLAKKIHLWQIRQGQSYGCQFCHKESLAMLWTDMYTCPLCGRKYDWMMAQDSEE
jgi:ribosomal protein L37AE/L43A